MFKTIFEDDKTTIHQMNECKGPLKELWVVIHEDEEGNQGILAQQAFLQGPNGNAMIGAKAELTPYAHEIEKIEKFAQDTQKVLGKSGYKVKIKKFIAE